jgi:hypothetical protein
MVNTGGTNYRETYFEYPELTRIHGEPDSESIHQLRNELKANAKSVWSNLGGGSQGHLGLVLDNVQYALVDNTSFVRPVHPGALIIPNNSTGPQIAALQDLHKENLRLFREVEGVEKALIQQLVKAVDPPYLASIRDRNSNSLRGNVSEILEHLRDVYGRISPQMMENKEQELRTMVYHAKYPIDQVFNAVEDFVEFASLAQQPITQRQTVAKAYLVLNKTGRFKQAITEWNRKTDVQQTWIHFKEHFRQAHKEFRETTDITLEESELQRNNANLVQQVVDGLQSVMTPAASEVDQPPDLIQQMANSAARSNETQKQLMQQLAEMQQAMQQLQLKAQTPAFGTPYNQFPPGNQQPQYFPPPYPPRGGNGRGYQGRNPRGGFGNRGRGNNYRQRKTTIYCWTHGGCGHTGNTCLTKLPGHQDAATFENKLGGNTANCPN